MNNRLACTLNQTVLTQPYTDSYQRVSDQRTCKRKASHTMSSYWNYGIKRNSGNKVLLHLILYSTYPKQRINILWSKVIGLWLIEKTFRLIVVLELCFTCTIWYHQTVLSDWTAYAVNYCCIWAINIVCSHIGHFVFILHLATIGNIQTISGLTVSPRFQFKIPYCCSMWYTVQ